VAQFVHQYVETLLPKQASAGQMLGVSIYGTDRQTYVLNLTVLTLIGVVMKKISEVAPAVTDAVWLDALSHALDASAASPWSQAMLDQVDPDATPAVD
jgi:hypothetical protein